MKNKLLNFILIICMILSMMPISNVEAATKKNKTSLSSKSVTMTVGQKKTLKLKNYKKLSKKNIKKVKWSTSNKKVVTVKYSGKYRQEGKITAKKKGSAYIKVKYNGKTYSCKINVKAKKNTSNTEEPTTTENNDVTTEETKSTTEEQITSTEQPTTEEPTTEKPTTTEQPTTEQPTTEEPTKNNDYTDEELNNLSEGDHLEKKEYSLKLAEYKNDYAYDTYEDGQDRLSCEYSYTTNDGITYNKSYVTNRALPIKISFNINVKHSVTIASDGNPLFDKGKTWIYNNERTLVVNKNNLDDTEYNKYISSILFSAIDLKTGKEIDYPLANVIESKVIGNSTYFNFPKGYLYSVTLPNTICVMTKTSDSSTMSGSYKDSIYKFIVGNIEDIPTLNIPENLNVNVILTQKNGVKVDINEDNEPDYYVPLYSKSINLTTDMINTDFIYVDNWSNSQYVSFDTIDRDELSNIKYSKNSSGLGYVYYPNGFMNNFTETPKNMGISYSSKYEDLDNSCLTYKRLILDSFGYLHELIYNK